MTTESAKALTGQTAGQIPEQGASVQAGTIAEIDESEHVSPARSFRVEQLGFVSFPVVKKFTLPERLPYDVSSANFSIVSQDTELAQIMERMIAERKQVSATMPGTNADEVRATTLTSQSTASGSAATMSSLSASPVGNYYIYSFDGRLLSEYDIYGACLKDYVYMGNRLVAEYNPATSQYFYYTQDQIGSTRIVTNDSGAVVYAEAHDPYGGVQKTWPGNTFDPKRKFSDKERDEETSLDYFAARYYANSSYRWLSVDPVLITERAIARPQA